MSIRLAARRIPQGRDAASIRKWAMVFLTIGIIGRSVVQLALLNMNTITGEELLNSMQADPMAMARVAVALVY